MLGKFISNFGLKTIDLVLQFFDFIRQAGRHISPKASLFLM